MPDLKERILESIRAAREDGPAPEDFRILKRQIVSMAEGDEKEECWELMGILTRILTDYYKEDQYSENDYFENDRS